MIFDMIKLVYENKSKTTKKNYFDSQKLVRIIIEITSAFFQHHFYIKGHSVV